ncbi:cysteine desulfurase [Synechococcus sp. PROS-9-1]|uniref:cysteine desulfurase family protein n=1 Tax=Synechococcus sp. PROS-9-1 TaxID=1968775 RepID=UPI0016478010|nr:aminotransferase class V-fold PLP-dependent enzyme [Synechococcus sp. PROS-9-1]QNJ31705.1 cysteine desulfurase [Synechococcus sp. PROS-9-1]
MTGPEDPYFYLDACATAPLRESVISCMVRAQQDGWGNPSSLHRIGCDAAESLERARLSISASLGAERSDILFSSGATESAHLALIGLAKTQSPGRLVISAVEHPAVAAAAHQLVACGWTVERWPVDAYGQIQMQHLDRLLQPPTKIVSLIWGQSEVGTLQPIQAVGEACRSKHIPFHTDATQVLSQGCPNWSELQVDLLTASAHKCGGPRGIGLLLIRQEIAERIQPLFAGGQQENGLRAGTECPVLAQGMAAAFREIASCQAHQVEASGSGIARLRDALLALLCQNDAIRLSGHPRERLPHHLSVLISDRHGQPMSGRALVRALDREGIAASSGSACSSGRDSDSPVLAAMGVDPAWQRSGLRLSLGNWIDPATLPNINNRIQIAIDRLEHN